MAKPAPQGSGSASGWPGRGRRRHQHRPGAAQGRGSAPRDDGRGQTWWCCARRMRRQRRASRWRRASEIGRPNCWTQARRIGAIRLGHTGSRSWKRSQPGRIAGASKVANPGCYPTGGIALLRPLVDSGLLPLDTAISVNAVSGYFRRRAEHDRGARGRGRPGIRALRAGARAQARAGVAAICGADAAPIFVLSVAHIRQGMLVSVPLHLGTLPGKPGLSDVHAALAARYAASTLVRVAEMAGGAVSIEGLADSDVMTPACVRACRAWAGGVGGGAGQFGQGGFRGGSAMHATDAGPGTGAGACRCCMSSRA